jgi:hypothetical protein
VVNVTDLYSIISVFLTEHFGKRIRRYDLHVMYCFHLLYQQLAARSRVVGWGTMLQSGSIRVRFPMRLLDSIYLILPAALGSGVDSASNRNEYQKSSWGVKRGRCVMLTTLPPTVRPKMLEPRLLTTLWAFTACYRDGFTFFYKNNWVCGRSVGPTANSFKCTSYRLKNTGATFKLNGNGNPSAVPTIVGTSRKFCFIDC